MYSGERHGCEIYSNYTILVITHLLYDTNTSLTKYQTVCALAIDVEKSISALYAAWSLIFTEKMVWRTSGPQRQVRAAPTLSYWVHFCPINNSARGFKALPRSLVIEGGGLCWPFCLQASAAALTGAGSLENPSLIGSVSDTVSTQPQRKQVTTTDSWSYTMKFGKKQTLC